MLCPMYCKVYESFWSLINIGTTLGFREPGQGVNWGSPWSVQASDEQWLLHEQPTVHGEQWVEWAAVQPRLMGDYKDAECLAANKSYNLLFSWH